MAGRYQRLRSLMNQEGLELSKVKYFTRTEYDYVEHGLYFAFVER